MRRWGCGAGRAHPLPVSGGGSDGGTFLVAAVRACVCGDGVRNWSVDQRSGMAVTLAMALLGALIGISSIGLHWRGLAVLGAAAGYLALALTLAGVWSGPYLPIGPGLAALALSFGLGGAAEAFFSVQEKAFIRQAFSHYLEPAMVDRLAKDRSSTQDEKMIGMVAQVARPTHPPTPRTPIP